MEYTESSNKQTTINIEHFDIAHLPALDESQMIRVKDSQMIRVKQTKPTQMLLYLISNNIISSAIYFLSVALFYLVVCLRKNRHIECQL